MFTNKKVLLVCSPYYKDITQNLIKGAIKVLKSNSVEYKIINVPGALEIAPSIKIYSEKPSKESDKINIYNNYSLQKKEYKKFKMHIDGIQEITTVDNYKVELTKI